jgi:hypothetical protein
MKLIKHFIQVREELIEVVTHFPGDKIETILSGQWNIKQILSHISGWDGYFALIALLHGEGKEIPFRGDKIEQWNAIYVNERSSKKWLIILDEFIKTGETFIQSYRNIDAQLWNKPFWLGRQATPDWVVNHNTNHYQSHLNKIHFKLKEWKNKQTKLR